MLLNLIVERSTFLLQSQAMYNTFNEKWLSTPCLESSGGHLTDYWGGGQNFNYQDNSETDDRFKCHDTINFIVKKVNHCCFSGTALQTFSPRLLGGDGPPRSP